MMSSFIVLQSTVHVHVYAQIVCRMAVPVRPGIDFRLPTESQEAESIVDSDRFTFVQLILEQDMLIGTTCVF